MKYILLISLFAFCGCSRNEWEFQKKVPLTTSVSDLLQMETELRAKGYKRVTIHEWYGCAVICATRTEGEVK